MLSCFAIFSRASFAPPRQMNLTSRTLIAFLLVFDTTSTLPPCISFHAMHPFSPLKKSKQSCRMVSSSCNTLLHSAGLKRRSLRLGAPFLGKGEFQSFYPQPWAVINTCKTADLCFLLKALSSYILHDTASLTISNSLSPSSYPASPLYQFLRSIAWAFDASPRVPQGDGTTGTPRPTKAASPAASAWFSREVSALAGLSLCAKNLSMGRNTLLAFSEVILANSHIFGHPFCLIHWPLARP